MSNETTILEMLNRENVVMIKGGRNNTVEFWDTYLEYWSVRLDRDGIEQLIKELRELVDSDQKEVN